MVHVDAVHYFAGAEGYPLKRPDDRKYLAGDLHMRVVVEVKPEAADGVDEVNGLTQLYACVDIILAHVTVGRIEQHDINYRGRVEVVVMATLLTSATTSLPPPPNIPASEVIHVHVPPIFGAVSG